MSELMNIIEELRKQEYFISDFQYEFLDDERISLDGGLGGIWPNPDKARGHRSLAKVLKDHVENGIHTNPTQIKIDFMSRKMNLDKPFDRLCNDIYLGEESGRFWYPVRVNVPDRTMWLHLDGRKLQNPEKFYEDVIKVFQSYGWTIGKEVKNSLPEV
jgi:hypothetical protein